MELCQGLAIDPIDQIILNIAILKDKGHRGLLQHQTCCMIKTYFVLDLKPLGNI